MWESFVFCTHGYFFLFSFAGLYNIVVSILSMGAVYSYPRDTIDEDGSEAHRQHMCCMQIDMYLLKKVEPTSI